MPRTKPVQARSKEMRDRILTATAQVLAERGYAGLSTNRVAAQAGVSVGSLYRYFEDRTDLMEHLRRRVTETVVADLTEAMVAAVRMESFAGVRHVVSTLVAALVEHGPVVKALLDEVPLGSHANALPAVELQLGQFARMFTAQQAPPPVGRGGRRPGLPRARRHPQRLPPDRSRAARGARPGPADRPDHRPAGRRPHPAVSRRRRLTIANLADMVSA